MAGLWGFASHWGSILARGGLAMATMSMSKTKRKKEPKEFPSSTDPFLLIADTRQLDILATTLNRASPSPKFQSTKLWLCISKPS